MSTFEDQPGEPGDSPTEPTGPQGSGEPAPAAPSPEPAAAEQAAVPSPEGAPGEPMPPAAPPPPPAPLEEPGAPASPQPQQQGPPPGPQPPVPPGWGGPVPQPPARRSAGLSLAHFLAPGLTLGVGLLVGLGVFFSTDAPDSFIMDRLVPYAALLAALAATVGLLLSLGELDLSSFGILALAGLIYVDVSESSIAGAILLGVLAGLFVGVVIGVLRWLTRAPSGLLSLAGGLIASTVYLQLRDLGDESELRRAVEHVEGWWLQVLTGLAFVAAAVVLGALFGLMKRDGREDSSEPGLRVIPGFALSGAAAGTVGAVYSAWFAFGIASPHWSFSLASWLLPLFGAVAIGGVLRGSSFVAPVTAALGAVATTLLLEGGRLHGWEQLTVELVLLGLLLGALVATYGLDRLLGGGSAKEAPAAPPPSQPVPF